MVFITGDTHGDFSRFTTTHFPQQKELTKDDYVIICGDFGGVWNAGESSPEEDYKLNWLSQKPFTTLFVDGNHSNFDRLKRFPRKTFHGGLVHQIRDNIFHLMRGYVFEINGKKFFSFGGASSHDIDDGILDPPSYPNTNALIRDYRRITAMGLMVRINHISWWRDELPSKEEMDRGIKNLDKHENKVDFVISHCLPTSMAAAFGYYDTDKLNQYFEKLLEQGKLRFEKWYCGHYHRESRFGDFIIKYENIERII